MTRQKVQTGMAFLIELAQTMSQFSYSNIKLARAVAERDRLTAQAQAAAEELRRSNQELEQFGYIASHDLQEPLRQVRSFTQLLQQRYADRLDDKALQYMGFVTEGAARMSDLVQDLLTYSRVGARDCGGRVSPARPLWTVPWPTSRSVSPSPTPASRTTSCPPSPPNRPSSCSSFRTS